MSLPEHIAIIMDGNGRWAQMRSRPRTYGHIKGTRVAKKIITSCSRKGIKYLTLYAFSSENWMRPKGEVSLLMSLLKRYLHKETNNLVKENIFFETIGDLSRLPEDVLAAIAKAKKATSQCTGLRLTFAISYGSRWEIASAAKALARQVADGTLDPEDIDESLLNAQMHTYPMPDPDLIIRTSGEKRLSNFLMWQAAYSEFYFSETLWPDFTELDLDLAIGNYLKRERRFGALTTSQNPTH